MEHLYEIETDTLIKRCVIWSQKAADLPSGAM